MVDTFTPADSGTPASGSAQALQTRRRIAEALMRGGADVSPVGHWTQGLGRVAQALVGGWMGGEAERREVERDAGLRSAVAALLGGGGPPTSPPPSPAPVRPPQGASFTPTEYTPGAGMADLPEWARSGATAMAMRPSAPEAPPPAPGTGPASIRFHNPGGMYPGASSRRFGSTGHEVIGGGHQIAVFPDAESGAAAQLHLLSSPGYINTPLAAIINRWSGGNNWQAYLTDVSRRAGIRPDEPVTAELLASPRGVALAQAMARWEAGRDYPLDTAGWQRAQARAFGLTPPTAGTGGPPTPGTAPPPGGGPPTAGAGGPPTAGTGGPQFSPQVRQAITAMAAINPQAALQMVTQFVTRGEQPTDQQRNYAAYVRDQIARGQPVASFNEWGLEQRRAGATAITTVERGERAFESEAGKRLATQYTEMVQAGRDARNYSAMLGILAEMAPQIGTGLSAQVRARLGPLAEALGVRVEGLGDTQAFQAIVNQLAPRMRAPGSGATSDMEMRQYLLALPTLMNTPEGNQLIAGVNRAIAESQIQAADIASQALEGTITRQEAERRLRALPNPLEAWLQTRRGTTGGGGGGGGGATRRYNPQTGQLE
jgi:hypothetical protein